MDNIEQDQNAGKDILGIDPAFWIETHEGRTCYAHIMRQQKFINSAFEANEKREELIRQANATARLWMIAAILGGIGFAAALWRR